MIKVIINDKEYSAQQGQTILEVVEEYGIDTIPTLCYSRELEPYTSCYICVVEVEGAPRLVPSCATEIRDGMKVNTRNERILASRKMNLELLLSNHRADCFPPCRLACPANVDIQGYVALTARGNYYEGQKLMKETNPLPMVCGRVCARPCEDDCRRNYVDEPVDIKNIKRFMADKYLEEGERYIPECKADSGKRAAVVGGGPAGLTAAYYLRLQGHSVTIFEMMPEPGGMMRYGIPEYRLPKGDLAKEIDAILAMGVELKVNVTMGKDFTIESLKKDGFDAIFLGIGAWKGSSTGCDGEGLDGIRQSIDFLCDVNSGDRTPLKGKVCVIGGGNTAMDAARSALRLGAEKVTVLYRRTETEMPANREEVLEAKEEGVEFEFLCSPTGFTGLEGKVSGIKMNRMKLGEADDSGRRRPIAIEGSDFIQEADHVFEAVGQWVDCDCLGSVSQSSRGLVEADEGLLLTNIEGVFAGGDAVTGPYIIIGAVAQGRKAAHAMDRYLKGEELSPENRLGFKVKKEDFDPVDREEFATEEKIPRYKIGKRSPEERRSTFNQVELGFTEDDVLKEAARCMECGCQDIFECKLKYYSNEYKAETDSFPSGEIRIKSYESGHPNIAISPEKCINCGLCVRLCSTVEKQGVFGIDGRGFQATPVPCNFTALADTTCVSCGLCVSNCPVGAIVERLPMGKPGPFLHTQTESHCILCGDGCPIVVESRDDMMMKVSSKLGRDIQLGPLCERGRFSYPAFLKNIDSAKNNDSLAMLKRELQGVDPEKVLVSASPFMTIEELDIIRNFTEKRSYMLYSPEFSRDKDKYELLTKAGISFSQKAFDNRSNCTSIFCFGDFQESANSVSFRKLIRNDDTARIYTTSGHSTSYFNHETCSSNEVLLEELKDAGYADTLVVLHLQSVDISTISEILETVPVEKRSNVLVLNSYNNYAYFARIFDTGSSILGSDSALDYSLCLSFNSSASVTIESTMQRFDIAEPGISEKTPDILLKPFYARNGSFFDQWGNVVRIAKGYEGAGLEVEEVISYLDSSL